MRAYLATMVVLGALAQPLLAKDFYVWPGGRDDNPGTRRQPFASLTAARDAVRAEIANGQRRNITVYIGAGTYFVEEPIVLDDRDSGRDGFTITYQGAPKLGARIYGGRRITGWTKLNDQEYVAEVPDLQQHFMLYENEQAANGGIFHTFHDAPEGNWRREGTRLIYHPRTLPIEDQLIVLGTAKDVFRIEGRSMTQLAGNLVFDGLYMIGSDFAPEWKRGDSYTTNWDGEYDGRPWNGQSLGDGVIAPDMRHGQFYVENARRVTIRNSKLYGAGFMGLMANRWAQEIRVENNWIENAGCNGLFFMGWECGRGPFTSVAESYVNKNHVIRNNVFYDIGRFSPFASGIYFNFSGDNLVEHNVFHGITHYGVTLKGWPAILVNRLHATNRDVGVPPDQIKPFDMEQIKIYGEYVVTEENEAAALLHSRNCVIRYNDFSQIARFGDDMGMISMWGGGTNNVWAYNACHDGTNTSGWEHWLHVLFNDDGSHQAKVVGNIIYWITGGGRSRAIMSKGNDQLNLYNIIADCDLSAAATIQPFVCASHHMVWSHNIVAAQINMLYEGGFGTQKAMGRDQPILKEAKQNLYFFKPLDPTQPSEAGEKNIRNQVESRSKAAHGIDRDSVYADPMFVRPRPWWDAHYTDYRLKPESPAFGLGFQETDMSKIGLRDDFPFDLVEIIGHPAGKTRLAADFSRIFKNRITNQQVRSRHGSPLYKDSWTRYNHLDFGDGAYRQFRARLEWVAPAQTFEKEIDGKTIPAMWLTDVWRPHPYWEISTVFTEPGKTGPELFDVEFAPEKGGADQVKWKPVIEELVSRATVRNPLGVINADIANGENHANSACYARSSVYLKGGGRTDIEVRGAHGVKVWVNGQLVFSQLGDLASSKRVSVEFKRGWNEFLVKIVQDDQPWTPAMQGYGNFWATVNMHYVAVGGGFIVPGLPGVERFVDPHQGAAVELRLGAPDGKLIGTLPFKQTTCEIEKVTGRHDLFLVFPNENVQSMDWFRFE
jgi:hypothetical protein